MQKEGFCFMGAIKNLLPENWLDIKEEEIKIINVSANGFYETLTINDDESVTERFGHTFDKKDIGSIKEMVERLIMNGFEIEIKTKKEETQWEN